MKRTSTQLATLLLLCGSLCWLLSRPNPADTILVSGQMIDWSTGLPAANADLDINRPGYYFSVARTNAHGYFQVALPYAPAAFFFSAAPPRYGTLLQTRFGKSIVALRKGEKFRNLILPAIPSTELSGHIYDTEDHPLSGCYVSALTRVDVNPRKSVTLDQWGTQDYSDNLLEADDPAKFIVVEHLGTAKDGSFHFTTLGADRCFLLTRCDHATGSSWWKPAFYPAANSLNDAQEILLHPGERRSGFDFHLARGKTYPFEGKLILSDGSAPKHPPETMAAVFRADRTLTSTYPGREDCEASTGNVRCGSLLAGTYTLYVTVPERLWPHSSEFAKISFTVPSKNSQPMTIHLHSVPDSVETHSPEGVPHGVLDLRQTCDIAVDQVPAIEVMAWGRGHSARICPYMLFRPREIPLPPDTYTVNAFEQAFMHGSYRNYLGDSEKVEALLMKHGSSVQIKTGQTRHPNLPLLSTSQIISIALAYLR